MKPLVILLALAWVPMAGAAPPRDPAAEAEIRHLLQFVRQSQAVFIRNGRTYPPEEAAAHLQRKQDHHQAQISTAEDFIRLAGTRSLFTGEAYQVRLEDGTILESRDWLTAELDRQRAAQNTANPQPPPP